MKIWIINHYATDTFFDKGGRHYYFAKGLIEKGHDVRIFCASTVHNDDMNIPILQGKYKEDHSEGIPYTFIKTSGYKGNGLQRINNIVTFFYRLLAVLKRCISSGDVPDIIIASSVHPLTLVAGIKIGRKYGIPCICEIRDLWPESLIAYDIVGKRNPIVAVMNVGKKWVYSNSDAIIFTMPDGEQNIIDHGWENYIDLSKIYYINNGVDIEDFERHRRFDKLDDDDLNDNKIKVVYTGSIRKVNSVGLLVDVAEALKNDGRFKILVYGDGEDVQSIKESIEKRKLTNIQLKGKIEKKYVPYVLSKGDVNVITGGIPELVTRYGLSLNKLFEYLASGRPIVAHLNEGKTKIIQRQGKECGVAKHFVDGEEFANNIKMLFDDENQYKTMCMNAKETAQEYDFHNLTEKLEKVIVRVTVGYNEPQK